MMDTEKFMSGQKACQRGDVCPAGAHPDFVLGFSAQYEIDQILDEKELRRAY